MSVLTINGTALPDPAYKGYKTIKQELVYADRMVTGRLVKRRLQEPFKVTISVKWVALTDEQKTAILQLTQPNSFQVSYLDMETSTRQIATVYRGNDLEIEGYGKFNDSTGKFQYYDMTMSLIEL